MNEHEEHDNVRPSTSRDAMHDDKNARTNSEGTDGAKDARTLPDGSGNNGSSDGEQGQEDSGQPFDAG